MVRTTHSVRDRVSELRAAQSRRPLLPYERLHPADSREDGGGPHVSATVSGEWRWQGRAPVDLRAPVRWGSREDEDRGWELALQSWEALAPVLAHHRHTGEGRLLDFAVTFACDWLMAHPTVSEGGFAWYDTAVGMRAYRLAYTLDAACRGERYGDEAVACLLDGLLLHSAVLADADTFVEHTNHGLYQIMGQLAMARRFPDLVELEKTADQAISRLQRLMRAQFTDEAIHREHSPGYQELMRLLLAGLLREGLVDAKWIRDLHARIEESLAWFVLPSGTLAMFGDTSGADVTRPNVADIGNPALRFVLSRGAEGRPPDHSVRAFPTSGYAVFRDRWPQGEADFEDCSYLAQTCAFHSRTHKHADDLSFIWYDRGHQILTDAGRFGYAGRTDPSSELARRGFWYSEPRRVYVESTRAHNTVEIDWHSYNRSEAQPYGSALRSWGSDSGIMFSEAVATHGPVEHRRVLVFHPRRWLLVLDWLSDPSHAPHDFSQHFHFAPGLEAVAQAAVASVTLPNGARLHALDLNGGTRATLVRGRQHPHLLGWMSPRDGQLIPQWTLQFIAEGVASHTFAALLAFGEGIPADGRLDGDASMDGGELLVRWRQGSELHEVQAERQAAGSLTVRHRMRG